MVRMGSPVRFRPGGGIQALTSGNAGELPSIAVVADHIGIGMDAQGQLAVRVLIALLTSNFGCRASGMARIGLIA
jgi:hypothetical protein